jgi:hypothetical protein
MGVKDKNMPTNLLTQKRLREVLEYSPETGVFVWKVRMSNRVKAGDIAESYNNYGYIRISIDSKRYQAHRLAFLYVEGYLPEYEVDHLNGIRDDNRWANLRHVTKSCNMQNYGFNSASTSGFTGIYWNKYAKKWQAYITIHGKRIHLGCHDTIEEAALARCYFEDKCPDWTCNHLAMNRIKLRSMGYEI